MEKTKLFKEINQINDKKQLVDMFYDILNEFEEGVLDPDKEIDESLLKPLNKLDKCVHIVNKIKTISNEDTFDIDLELRNLYVMCLNQLERTKLELIYEKKYNKDLVESKMNLGFGLISKKVEYDKETLDYVSKEMIKDLSNDIFEGKDIEEDIHKMFKTKYQFKNNGIKKSIIDILFNYDSDLSDYIAVNPNILDVIEDRIEEYLFDFDNYDEKRICKAIMREVKDYCIDHEIRKDYESLLLRLSAEYNIYNDMIKYSKDFKDKNYNDLKYYTISESRNGIDDNYVNLRKIFDKYTKEQDFKSTSNVMSFKKGK